MLGKASDRKGYYRLLKEEILFLDAEHSRALASVIG